MPFVMTPALAMPHMCRRFCTLVLFEDIADAMEHVVGGSSIIEVENPKIIAVYKLETFKACIRCQCRVEPGSPHLGRCIDCGVLQNYDFCTPSIIAQVLVLVGSKMHSFQVSGEPVLKLAGTSCNPTEDALLRAKIASFSFNSDTKEILKVSLL